MKKKYIPESKIILVILDGYGQSPASKGNAIKKARTPFIKTLWKKYPHTLLKAHGKEVGIPQGNQGGSEVGHFTMGAGRIVYQTLEQINCSIRSGTFFNNKVLLKAIYHVKKYKSKLHFLGMISDQGVHSDIKHLFTLISLAKKHKIQRVYIHAITDGRDVPEKSAHKYLSELQIEIKKLGYGKIATIIGRYYAMDRDNNWNRTKKAYQLITQGKGLHIIDPLTAIDEAYKRGDDTDYYIQPIILDKEGLIEKNDAVIFFNFRTDRARQLTQPFVEPQFNKFKTHNENIKFIAFGPYTKYAPVAFPTPKIKNNLGALFSQLGLRQLRIAETEKYAHVTYFFNSQIKEPFTGEDRILIDSPKTRSYAEKPEMSASNITKEAYRQLKKKKYDIIILNYANADLVGHSGNLQATIQCIAVLDNCLKKLVSTALRYHYTVILTADHGNAEQMLYKDGSPCPSHSKNPVPFFIICEPPLKVKLKKGKGLKDVAPTILELMNIKKPKEMTGKSLLAGRL